MKKILIIIIILSVFDIFIWAEIALEKPSADAKIYALDVGQGDSELVILPGGMKMLIDGGPNGKIIEKLNSVLGPFDRYIDLVVLSHPQLDHFGGLTDVFKRYKVGALLFNGEDSRVAGFEDFKKSVIVSKGASIVLKDGDRINFDNNLIEIISPSGNLLQSGDINEAALVLKMEIQGIKTLFTGDIGVKTEEDLLKNHNLDIDILKVAHHGSKFSTSENFLKAATPKISLIEVGAKNTYGHPTAVVLSNLKKIGSKIFRTDLNGTIGLIIKNDKISILSEK